MVGAAIQKRFVYPSTHIAKITFLGECEKGFVVLKNGVLKEGTEKNQGVKEYNEQNAHQLIIKMAN